MRENRRGFFKSVAAAGVGLSIGTSALAKEPSSQAPKSNTQQGLPQGRLVVMGYEHKRNFRSHPGLPFRSALLSISYPDRLVQVTSSTSTNLHDIVFPFDNSERVFFGVGHDVDNTLEIFNHDLSLKSALFVDGWRFKGHGIAWGRGMLVAAERQSRPEAGGVLLHVNAQGTVLGHFPTGGLSPHEIIECGDYLAVAHYGNAPDKAPFRGGVRFNLVDPGVAFLDKKTLKLVKYHHLEESRGAITHIAKQGNGQVIAMPLQFSKPVFDGSIDMGVMREATLNGIDLIEEETGPNAVYQMPLPLYYVDVHKGVTGETDLQPSLMRRGQSFAQDASLGLTVGTFAASHTLLVQDANEKRIRVLKSLDFGIAEPRGCAMIPGTGCVAVSGNHYSIAIINLTNDRLVDYIGVPLERHSHLRWISA